MTAPEGCLGLYPLDDPLMPTTHVPMAATLFFDLRGLPYSKGLRSPSIVGISSATVGWMCTLVGGRDTHSDSDSTEHETNIA